MHRPTTVHWIVVKHSLWYLRGTLYHGLFLHHGSSLSFHAFSDDDWASNIDDQIDSNAYMVFLGHNSISWSSHKQCSVACSSIEVEHGPVAFMMFEILWFRSLLHKLGVTLPEQPIIYCDNVRNYLSLCRSNFPLLNETHCYWLSLCSG